MFRFASAIGDRRYGLKKLADKNFRELIYGVILHTKPGKHYDARIALFSDLCGMTDMEDFSPTACGTLAKLHRGGLSSDFLVTRVQPAYICRRGPASSQINGVQRETDQ